VWRQDHNGFSHHQDPGFIEYVCNKKPDVVRADGGDVESHFREGKIKEIAAYCEVDVINTYQVWLRHELFRGKLTENEFDVSQWNLRDFIDSRSKPTDGATAANCYSVASSSS
jgi:predicted PolB exonuclease-like 3'-5' exonuclease